MELNQSLESFFRDEVERACQAEGVQADGLTALYLVHLLGAYAAQPIEDRPLALRMLEAVGLPDHQRRAQLREVGDTSLFLSGFWSDSLGSRLVDVDYYVALGGSAYRELASAGGLPGDAGKGRVFADLATNFVRFVEVLMTISRRTVRTRTDGDVVRLYERWLRTKSRWAARRLAEAGVIPAARRSGLVQ